MQVFVVSWEIISKNNMKTSSIKKSCILQWVQNRKMKNIVLKDRYAYSVDGLSASSLKGSGAAYRAQGLL
jgi:hypothetical protein